MYRKSVPPKKISHIKALAIEKRHHPSPAENMLWMNLKANGLENVHFRRQHPIGNYIVDFCAVKEKLIIELDGSQHLAQESIDQKRTEYLECAGFRVLRFWNNEIEKDIDGVIEVISNALDRN